MTRLIEIFLLATLLTLLAAPSLSVRRFIAPPAPADPNPKEVNREGAEDEPAQDGSKAETSPLEILALRPELPQTWLEIVRALALARPSHVNRCGSELADPAKPIILRIDKLLVVRDRSQATSLAVVALPCQPHAPPATRPIA
jgi:hypothetical protein